MTPIDPNQTRVEAQHRSLLITWAGILAAVGGLLLLTILVPSNAQPEDKILPIVLIAVGFANVVLSFILKQSFLAKSVAQQDLKLVQQAYIVALGVVRKRGIVWGVDSFHYRLNLLLRSVCLRGDRNAASLSQEATLAGRDI